MCTMYIRILQSIADNYNIQFYEHPCRMALKESGKTSVVHAREAKEEIDKRNLEAAKPQLASAERSAGKHLKKIEYLIKRYRAMEEHYMQKERDLTAEINSLHQQERSVELQKDAATMQLDNERSQLSHLTSQLSSAEDRRRDATRKREEANRNKTLLAILTLSTGASVAGALAAGAVGSAIAFDQAEKNAEDEVTRCQNRVADARESINRSERKKSSLSESISNLCSDISSLETRRHHLQEEKGKVTEVIAFLLKAQSYGNRFSFTTESCIDRTALVGDLVGEAEGPKYSLFDSKGTKRVLATFEEAWDTFEEMNDNGGNCIFKLDFKCTRCSSTCQEFPHVNNGQFICSSCHETLEQ